MEHNITIQIAFSFMFFYLINIFGMVERHEPPWINYEYGYFKNFVWEC